MMVLRGLDTLERTLIITINFTDKSAPRARARARARVYARAATFSKINYLAALFNKAI